MRPSVGQSNYQPDRFSSSTAIDYPMSEGEVTTRVSRQSIFYDIDDNIYMIADDARLSLIAIHISVLVSYKK